MPRSPRPTLKNLNYFDPGEVLSADRHQEILEAFHYKGNEEKHSDAFSWDEATGLYRTDIEEPSLEHIPEGRRLTTQRFLYGEGYNLLGKQQMKMLITVSGSFRELVDEQGALIEQRIRTIMREEEKIATVFRSDGCFLNQAVA
jgi:hypothetical protein